MAFAVWKMIRGKGPYAYMRQSVRVEGKVRTRHLGYLGYWNADGSGTISPGSVVAGPDGRPVVVPRFTPLMLSQLGITAEDLEAVLGTTGAEVRAEPLGTTAPSGTGESLGTTTYPSPDGGDQETGTTKEGPDTLLGTTDPGAYSDETGITSGGDSPAQGAPAPIPVNPYLLPDNSWGVLSQEQLAVGDLVTVRTRSGKSWMATVTEIMKPVHRGFVARTSRPPHSRG